MSIIQHIDQQKNTGFVIWDGEVSAEQWFQYAQKLVAHPAWPTTIRFLADVRTVHDISTIHDPEIERVVEIFSASAGSLTGKKVAIVAREMFGRARRFTNATSRLGVSAVVFNNIDTACLFLGIDATYASQGLQQTREQMQAT